VLVSSPTQPRRPRSRAGRATSSRRCYAAGLTRFLLEQGVDVVEAKQPHAHLRARPGKDDAIDAEAAALKALSGQASASPEKTTGAVESIRIIRLARHSAVRSRTEPCCSCATCSSPPRRSCESRSPSAPPGHSCAAAPACVPIGSAWPNPSQASRTACDISDSRIGFGQRPAKAAIERSSCGASDACPGERLGRA
jgi:hypothetical protein